MMLGKLLNGVRAKYSKEDALARVKEYISSDFFKKFLESEWAFENEYVFASMWGNFSMLVEEFVGAIYMREEPNVYEAMRIEYVIRREYSDKTIRALLEYLDEIVTDFTLDIASFEDISDMCEAFEKINFKVIVKPISNGVYEYSFKKDAYNFKGFSMQAIWNHNSVNWEGFKLRVQIEYDLYCERIKALSELREEDNK